MNLLSAKSTCNLQKSALFLGILGTLSACATTDNVAKGNNQESEAIRANYANISSKYHLSLSAPQGFALLNYLEPQDSFEFTRSRLLKGIKAGTLTLDKEDGFALISFVTGLDEEGQVPTLRKGGCNQLTAILQAILVVLPTENEQGTYLSPHNISGFYDEDFGKALAKLHRDLKVANPHTADTSTEKISFSEVSGLLNQALRNNCIKCSNWRVSGQLKGLLPLFEELQISKDRPSFLN